MIRALLLLLVALPALADTVLLLNGNEVHGSIEDIDADPIVLAVPGGTLTFDRAEIQEFEINDRGLPEDKAEAKGEAVESAPAGPSIADLPPPATDEERARRYDMLTTTIARVSLNPEEASQEERDRMDDYAKALGQLGPAAAPQLEELFRNGDIRMAGSMLQALHGADPARAEALAKDALQHEHPDARAAAIAILAASNSKDKAGLLAAALSDPRPPNRAAALQAIAETKDPAAARAILPLTGDPALQSEAIAALQALTGQSFTTPEEWAAWAAQNPAP